MTKKLSRAWMSEEAKFIAKSKAARQGITLTQYLEDLVRKEDKENKGYDGLNFFKK